MRPVYQRLSAAGFSDWVPINYRPRGNFAIGLAVKLSDGATLTYSVQSTLDDIYAKKDNFSIARVTTTATVTLVNHGLSVGDWTQFSGAAPAPFLGQFSVASVVDADNFTFTVPDSGAASLSGSAGAWLQTARVFEHDTITAETTSQTGNYAYPPRATRLIISAYTDGFADFAIISAS